MKSHLLRTSILCLAVICAIFLVLYARFFSKDPKDLPRLPPFYHSRDTLKTKSFPLEKDESQRYNDEAENYPPQVLDDNDNLPLRSDENIVERDLTEVSPSKENTADNISEFANIEEENTDSHHVKQPKQTSLDEIVKTPYAMSHLLRNYTKDQVTLDIHGSNDPEVYKERRKLVYEQCAKYKKERDMGRINRWPGKYWINIKSYVIYSAKKVIWRLVPKCGTSYQKGYLRTMNHTPDYKRALLEMRSRGAAIKYWNYLHKEEGFMSIMFTRHPFSRILSAYRSKMESRPNTWKEIPSFSGMSHYVASIYNNGSNNTYCTFAQFVQAIIDKKVFNVHWQPLSEFVYPCDFSYRIIGKVETFNDDIEYIVDNRNIKTGLRQNYNKSPPTNKSEFFGTLTRTQLMNLYARYIKDFELYGYDYKGYLKYTKNE